MEASLEYFKREGCFSEAHVEDMVKELRGDPSIDGNVPVQVAADPEGKVVQKEAKGVFL